MTQVVTTNTDCTIRLPKKFADRLDIHAGEELIVQLIEDAGLILVFPSRRDRRPRPTESGRATLRRQVQQALENAGLLAPLDPEIVKQYVPRAGQQRLSPLKIGGKPVSEIIVEERGRW
jgi:antitoxin component of MazEF toxin-antitoxin module